MRFVLAVLAFLTAAALILVGVAQRTVWAPPSSVEAATSISGEAPLVVVDGAVLADRPGKQTISLEGDATVFAAYGRTEDVMAWVGEATYDNITLDETTGELVSTEMTGTETEVPSPAGSDLWLAEYQQEGALTTTTTLAAGMSLIIASDGAASPLSSIAVSWPMDDSTPFSTPLIIAGGVLLLVGLLLYLNAILNLRRRRGPKRRTPLPPKPLKASESMGRTQPKREVVLTPPKGRRSIRRSFIALPLAVAVVVGAAGCAPEIVRDQLGQVAEDSPTTAEPVPTETETETAPTISTSVAVTTPQVERILARIVGTAADADKARDAKLLATRFDGPAYDLRNANYKERAEDKDIDAPPTIPSGSPVLVLPEQTTTWPRSVFVVVQDGEGESLRQVMLALTQKTPRGNYRVTEMMDLYNELPAVAAADVGAPRVGGDVAVMALAPERIPNAYADILKKGEDSQFWSRFDLTNDPIYEAYGPDAKAAEKKALKKNATVKYSYSNGTVEPLSLATADAGALVAANIVETATFSPSEDGNTIKPGSPCSLLLGSKTTEKKLIQKTGMQIMFALPLAGGGKITPIGFNEGLLSCSKG